MKKQLLLSAIAWGIATGINAQTNTFPASGNVGIGTNTPLDKLHVNGRMRIEANYDNGGIGGTLILRHPGKIASGTAMDWNVYNMSGVYGNSLQFWAYSADCAGGLCKSLFTIMDNGNVSIGTTNPGSYKLAVEGTIGARKVKVTTASWADYVFEKNYHLPSLAEVEKYIQQHKHLPDVPAAAEIEKNGLDLGDNQAVLLKKIEELTLYAIDQHKRQADQDKKIEEQNKKIEILEVENKAFKILQNEVEKIKIERDGFIKNKSN